MTIPTMTEITDPAYIEMYSEYCAETDQKPTDAGYVDFVAWRNRVEALFDATGCALPEGKWIGPNYQVHGKG